MPGQGVWRKTLRLIQAGIGGFGSSWASEVVPSVEGVRPAAYVDVSAAALERLVTSGLTTQERCFSSIEEAVATVDSDAVLVTTPANWHIPVAQVAIEAGKHVLIEKPFAPSVETARQAVDLARRRGVTLMVSQNYRFHPAVHAVQQLVSSGELGKLYSIAVDFRKGVRKGAPRPGRKPLAEPLLADMSIHHFDLMRAVTGSDAKEIDCRTWKPEGYPMTGPSAGAALVTMKDGCTVSYRGSWVSTGPTTSWTGEWVMDFAGGQLFWTSRDSTAGGGDRVIMRTEATEKQLELPEVVHVDRAGSLAAFVAAARSGEEPETSGARNLASLAMTYAAIDSAASLRPVRLE